MAAPTYNCPFSASAASGGSVLTCTQQLALNSNASCALYDSKDQQCMLRQRLLRDKEFWRGVNAS